MSIVAVNPGDFRSWCNYCFFCPSNVDEEYAHKKAREYGLDDVVVFECERKTKCRRVHTIAPEDALREKFSWGLMEAMASGWDFEKRRRLSNKYIPGLLAHEYEFHTERGWERIPSVPYEDYDIVLEQAERHSRKSNCLFKA